MECRATGWTFLFKFNKRGQNLSEYSLLLALIMGGILIGGPMAINSWNAQAQSWNDSVIDSFTDPLLEADPTETACVCDENWSTPSLPGDCGVGSCNWNQYQRTRECAPLGCGEESECVPDEGCCSPPSLLPGCGAFADSACPGGCPDGEQCGGFQCGTDPTIRYGCFPGDCARCIGGPFSEGTGTLCPDDTLGLAEDTEYHAVMPGGCTDPRKCEVECIPPNVPIDGGRDCGIKSKMACGTGWPVVDVPANIKGSVDVLSFCPEPFVPVVVINCCPYVSGWNAIGNWGLKVRSLAISRGVQGCNCMDICRPNTCCHVPGCNGWAQPTECVFCGFECGNGICETAENTGMPEMEFSDEDCINCPQDCAVEGWIPGPQWEDGTYFNVDEACGVKCGNGICEGPIEVPDGKCYGCATEALKPFGVCSMPLPIGGPNGRALVCGDDCGAPGCVCGDGWCGGVGWLAPESCTPDCSPTYW